MPRLATFTCLALALSAPSSAQLIVNMTFNATSTTTEHYAIDLSTGTATQLFAGWIPPNGDPQLAGAAADPVGRIVYFSSNPTSPTLQDVIYSWPYNDPGGPQVVVTNPATQGGQAVDCSGLAFGGGTLYALNQYGGTPDGIYSIDLQTGVATLELLITGGLDVGGLAFNPSDGLLYGVNDAATGRGIYAFDLAAGTQTFVAAYPAGVTDVDGCAVNPAGAGVVYLIEDNPAPLHAYDLATGAYLPTIQNPVQGTFTYSGGAWAEGLFGPATIGTPYCAPGAVNSTGAAGELAALGTTIVASNDLTLEATGLPASAFGFFLASRTQALVPMAGGSSGDLCLGGAIGRYVGPGQIQNSGAAGAFSLVLDLTLTPQPTGFVSIAAGETWNFQAWHRDAVGGSATSNFTHGLEVAFN